MKDYKALGMMFTQVGDKVIHGAKGNIQMTINTWLNAYDNLNKRYEAYQKRGFHYNHTMKDFKVGDKVIVIDRNHFGNICEITRISGDLVYITGNIAYATHDINNYIKPFRGNISQDIWDFLSEKLGYPIGPTAESEAAATGELQQPKAAGVEFRDADGNLVKTMDMLVAEENSTLKRARFLRAYPNKIEVKILAGSIHKSTLDHTYGIKYGVGTVCYVPRDYNFYKDCRLEKNVRSSSTAPKFFLPDGQEVEIGSILEATPYCYSGIKKALFLGAAKDHITVKILQGYLKESGFSYKVGDIVALTTLKEGARYFAKNCKVATAPGSSKPEPETKSVKPSTE